MKAKLFSLIFSVLFLISCSRPADTLQSQDIPIGEHIFTRAQVVEIMLTNGVNAANIVLTDMLYVAPDVKWVQSQYPPKLAKFLFDYNLNHWTKESNDCDNISRAAADYAAILFHNSKNRPSGKGFLFGEFHYSKKQLGGHAINIVIVKDGPIYRLLFFEPQLNFEVELTENEKFSGQFSRF